jgi:alanine racemase
MNTRCWVEVDGAALNHNLAEIRRQASSGCGVMAVVKANAYGHGLQPVAKEFAAMGVEWLGVAQVEEAVQLRKSGIRTPILILSACLKGELEEAVRLKLTPTLSSWTEAQWLEKAARTQRKTAQAHFKIDTGMGRLGCRFEEAEAEIARIARLKRVRIDALFTHFTSADTDPDMTRRQWRLFQEIAARFPDKKRHAANSAGLLADRRFSADVVRPGIALYGCPPLPQWQPRFRPALAWKSRVTLVKRMPKGRTLSYGATYRLPFAQTIAVVAVGYGDGYFRSLSNRGSVLIGGLRCPIRGRVTMDQILVDVSRVPDVKSGDEAVLIGKQGKAKIHAAEVAAWAGTISYEVLTNVGSRVPRCYRHFFSIG